LNVQFVKTITIVDNYINKAVKMFS